MRTGLAHTTSTTGRTITGVKQGEAHLSRLLEASAEFHTPRLDRSVEYGYAGGSSRSSNIY